MKNTVALVLKLNNSCHVCLNMDDLAQLECMLKAGVRVSGIGRYYNCHLSAIQHLRDCYQATRTVKG